MPCPYYNCLTMQEIDQQKACATCSTFMSRHAFSMPKTTLPAMIPKENASHGANATHASAQQNAPKEDQKRNFQLC
jgi:hypothetical protein